MYESLASSSRVPHLFVTEHRCLSLWTVRAQLPEQSRHASATTLPSRSSEKVNLALSGVSLSTNLMSQINSQQVKGSA